MNRSSLNRGANGWTFAATPRHEALADRANAAALGTILKRRRLPDPGAAAENRPLKLPPIHESHACLNTACSGASRAPQWSPKSQVQAIRPMDRSTYGTASDPDPEIRSHIRAILATTNDIQCQAARLAV